MMSIGIAQLPQTMHPSSFLQTGPSSEEFVDVEEAEEEPKWSAPLLEAVGDLLGEVLWLGDDGSFCFFLFVASASWLTVNWIASAAGLDLR